MTDHGAALPELPTTTYVLATEGDQYSEDRIWSFPGYDDEAMRAYALAAVEAERQRIIAIVMNERVDAEATQSDQDEAYNLALIHAVDAIRASSKAEGA